MSAEAPFSGSAVRLLVAVVGGSLLLGLALLVFGNPVEGPPAGVSSASRSALGHAAFVQLLERSGFPVIVSRLPSAPRPGALLVLAEPEPDAPVGTRQRVREQLERWERVLLVLPKRQGQEDPARPGWLGSVSLVAAAEIDRLLSDAGLEARVERLAADEQGPLAWNEPYGFLPTLARPQLLTGAGLQPVIDCERGLLVARLDPQGDSRRTVLSDPDLLANHGLGQGDNAALMLALVRDLVPDGAPIVIDETLHGGVRASGLWSELLRFPLVLVAVQVLLTLGVGLFAAVGRFGPPQAVPPVLERSKQALLDHGARLLLLAGHERALLQRYLRQSLHEAAEACHLGPEVDPGTRLEHLRRRSRKLGLGPDPRELLEDVSALEERASAAPQRTLRLARRIHSWREGMTNGPRSST